MPLVPDASVTDMMAVVAMNGAVMEIAPMHGTVVEASEINEAMGI